ncbi:hypothetical protein CLHUN_39290 [Ruminiclostridium hungatei]|uniref:Uncharacterized protein n=1 Tax=Ruminiclostridium hungatei TaxID=48256 RepID=A0A1V4SEH7_RUMHU|nr:hypothetical protein [Ruminiclostridium hungatei]OPX42143.1 hypothetical protein CLHUN_39290 [Ruminiclostridium hungatei]
MTDRKSEQDESSITEKFRRFMEDERLQKNRKSTVPESRNLRTAKEDTENDEILSRIIADVSCEILVQGLVYSEVFGLPRCKRRGR